MTFCSCVCSEARSAGLTRGLVLDRRGDFGLRKFAITYLDPPLASGGGNRRLGWCWWRDRSLVTRAACGLLESALILRGAFGLVAVMRRPLARRLTPAQCRCWRRGRRRCGGCGRRAELAGVSHQSDPLLP